MMIKRFKCALLMAGIWLSLVSFSTSVVKLDKVVVFGDSLSDTGNLYAFMNYKFPLSPPYYNGRFSDGPIWVEKITETLAQKYPQIELINYAFAGAAVLEDEDFLPGVNISLKSQVNAYLNSNATKHVAHTLFLLIMGGNDYASFDEEDASHENVMRVTTAISEEAAKLAQKGARYILIGNLPDMGKSPFAREMEMERLLSDVSVLHNQTIEQKFETLKTTYPKTHWIFFDIFSFFTDAFKQPEKYGFKYTDTPCYQLDSALAFNTSDINAVQQRPSLIAASHPKLLSMQHQICDEYLFFDILHPTQRGHAFAAELALKQINRVLD